MHKLLLRQIKRCALNGELPEPVRALIALVEEAYQSFDADRAMAERSMEICSRELTEHNQALVARNAHGPAAHAELQAMHADLQRLTEELEMRVTERTAELRAANEQLTLDIAYRTRVEESLRIAEEAYRTMFESATVGMFQTTPDGHYLKC